MKGSVIHIVENLDKGAVENWLVNIFLESRKKYPDLEWTFFCMLGKEGRLDEKVKAAGGKIIYSPYWISEKWKFFTYLKQTLKKGNYDVLHLHHDYLAGFHLLSAIGVRYKQKIVHVHNTDKWLPVGNARVRKWLLGPARWLVMNLADQVIGISKDTLSEFIGKSHNRKIKAKVLYYGIDLSKFDRQPLDIRRSFTLPADSKILLFIGRMNEFKNPAFVVDILHEIKKYRNDVYGLFVGKGGEEETVKRKAVEYGISDRIVLAGWRDDVPEIMKGSDLFVFPRVEYPREGLGLVVVESQAAGLPMVLSPGIVPDAVVINELACFIPLAKGPDEWAHQVHNMLEKGKPLPSEEACNKVKLSAFNLPLATDNLVNLYPFQ